VINKIQQVKQRRGGLGGFSPTCSQSHSQNLRETDETVWVTPLEG